MNKISSKLHGVLDYAVGTLLIVSPWLFNFATGGVAMWIPVSLGTAAILYSLVTNYELGLIRAIPFQTHLIIDAVSGTLLWISPWVFGFSDVVFLPHLLIGVLEIIVVLITNRKTSVDRPTTYS